MVKFILKNYNPKFKTHHTLYGVKEYYNGMYSNIDIVGAIKRGTYNSDFENLIYVREESLAPLVTNDKAWEDYTDIELLKLKEALEKIKSNMKKHHIDMNEPLEVLAYLYQTLQKKMKFYDMSLWSKFPVFDDVYLLYKNNTSFAGLINGYTSSYGICESLKLACNYFGIACDIEKVISKKEHYINKVYLDDGKISYISLADEIGLIDGYYILNKRRMIKRDKPIEKEKITYVYFLANHKEIENAHKKEELLKISNKSAKLSNHSKKILFDKINSRRKEKDRIEIKKTSKSHSYSRVFETLASITRKMKSEFKTKKVVALIPSKEKSAIKLKMEVPKKQSYIKILKSDINRRLEKRRMIVASLKKERYLKLEEEKKRKTEKKLELQKQKENRKKELLELNNRRKLEKIKSRSNKIRSIIVSISNRKKQTTNYINQTINNIKLNNNKRKEENLIKLSVKQQNKERLEILRQANKKEKQRKKEKKKMLTVKQKLEKSKARAIARSNRIKTITNKISEVNVLITNKVNAAIESINNVLSSINKNIQRAQLKSNERKIIRQNIRQGKRLSENALKERQRLRELEALNESLREELNFEYIEEAAVEVKELEEAIVENKQEIEKEQQRISITIDSIGLLQKKISLVKDNVRQLEDDFDFQPVFASKSYDDEYESLIEEQGKQLIKRR